jgi:predicted dehydrogenase
MKRREFLRNLTILTAGVTLTANRVSGANERLNLGFIGLGNRGDQVLDAFLAHSDAQVTAVCDLYQPYMDFACKKISEKHGNIPKQFKDYRKLLEQKDIDAVVICTPDHWHALQTIHAAQAGKDVYVEKPLSLTIHEGRQMVKAIEKYNRICQVGIHRRSVPVCAEAAELVRSGYIGKVTVARSFHIQNEWPKGIGNPPNSEPPADLNWDEWLGPAPKVPYNKNRTFYRFRWFYDYSGGQVTNFGVHYIDFIHWAIGIDMPEAVTAIGGKFAGIDDNREIPDTLEVIWKYPNDVLVTFSQFNATAAQWSLPGCEVEIRGTKGTLYLFGDGYEIVPDVIKVKEFPARTPLNRDLDREYREGAKPVIEGKKVRGKSTADTTYHARNFIDCVKSRKKPNCDIMTGHRSTTATLIANIALKTNSLLKWDGKSERFTNNDAANKYLSYKYRSPYSLPQI